MWKSPRSSISSSRPWKTGNPQRPYASALWQHGGYSKHVSRVRRNCTTTLTWDRNSCRHIADSKMMRRICSRWPSRNSISAPAPTTASSKCRAPLPTCRQRNYRIESRPGSHSIRDNGSAVVDVVALRRFGILTAGKLKIALCYPAAV